MRNMKPLAMAGGLIALYLVVYNWTGAGKLIDASSSGSVNVIRALQGK